MSSPRYTCRASAEITVMGARAPSAAATAVLPTPVGPTRTGTRGRSGSPKPPLQLVLRQLHDRRPPEHVVGRQGGADDTHYDLPHLVLREPLAGLDRGAAGEGGGEALQPVRQAAEAAAREIGHELLQAARRVEPWMRVGRRVNDHRAARERLDLIPDAPQQLPVGVHGLELRRREVERQWQQEALRGGAVARELAHHGLVQHALVRRVLIHDGDGGVGREDDIGVEDLEQRRCQVSGVRCQGGRREKLLWHLNRHVASDAAPGTPDTWHLTPDTYGESGGEGGQRLPHRLLDHPFHEELVAEAHLELRRMDVDVHRVSRELEEQDERRAVAGRDGRAVPRLPRAQDEGIADGASPHQHVAFASRGLRLRGPLGEAPHLERALAVADGEQRVRELSPPQLVYAVDGSRRLPDVEERTVVAL